MLAEVCKHKAVGSLDITHDKSVKRYNAWDLAAYTAGHGLPGSNSAVGDLCHARRRKLHPCTVHLHFVCPMLKQASDPENRLLCKLSSKGKP